MKDLKNEIMEGVEQLKEFNDMMEETLPEALPEVERTLKLLGPMVDKFMGTLWNGKTFDSLVVMGNASYIARALIAQGLDAKDVASTSVHIAKRIVELSRE